MIAPRYVQHISGVGARWALHDRTDYNSEPHPDWCVQQEECGRLFLPRSEYVEVPAPEVWVDATEDLSESARVLTLNSGTLHAYRVGTLPPQYRLRKVAVSLIGPGTPRSCDTRWAFLVEQKEQP